MAIDPRHAEAKADAKPDTEQADSEANRVTHSGDGPLPGWTFAEIGRRYNACDDISDVPAEFWAALGMDRFCDPLVQMARLITYAHSLNLFGLKGLPADAERREALAKAMGTTTDTLFGMVDQAIKTWEPMERKISTALHGEYAHASGEGDTELPFSEGDELDVDATIKAVDDTLDKEEKLDK